MRSSDCHANITSLLLSDGPRPGNALARPGSTRLAKAGIETQSQDRDDLGDVSTGHHCNGVGGWGNLQLGTDNAGGTSAKSILI